MSGTNIARASLTDNTKTLPAKLRQAQSRSEAAIRHPGDGDADRRKPSLARVLWLERPNILEDEQNRPARRNREPGSSCVHCWGVKAPVISHKALRHKEK
jgi:hypothetical protein